MELTKTMQSFAELVGYCGPLNIISPIQENEFLDLRKEFIKNKANEIQDKEASSLFSSALKPYLEDYSLEDIKCLEGYSIGRLKKDLRQYEWFLSIFFDWKNKQVMEMELKQWVKNVQYFCRGIRDTKIKIESLQKE